jgi:prepilin-type N-terminal cleavage/methylation domain-containing protein
MFQSAKSRASTALAFGYYHNSQMLVRSTRILEFPARSTRRSRAFTLLELMVTAGIIAILLAILFPAVHMTIEKSRRISCLGNVRALTAAILNYAAANDWVLPDAAGTNSAQSQLSPLATGLAAGSNVKGSPFYVLPSIGGLLQPYLSSGASVWTCPSATNQPPVLSGNDPFNGYQPPNQFLPQYDYLAAKDLIEFAMFAKPVNDQTKLRTWVTRNVSGLRLTKLVPLGTNTSVVLIHDLDSSYHTSAKQFIYTYPNDWDYFQNFGYLDGHAEGHAFHNVNEYMASFHGPIRQSWCGVDFATTFPEQYAGY